MLNRECAIQHSRGLPAQWNVARRWLERYAKIDEIHLLTAHYNDSKKVQNHTSGIGDEDDGLPLHFVDS